LAKSTLYNVEDQVSAQRERFAAYLRNDYEAKLGAIYSAQTMAELEPLAPWGLSPRQNRSRTRLVVGGAVCAVALAVLSVVAIAALGAHQRAPVAARAYLAKRAHGPSPTQANSVPPKGAVPATTTPATTTPATTTPATTTPAPSATTLPGFVPAAPPVYGSPDGTTLAVLSVDTTERRVTLVVQGQTVQYSVCTAFRLLRTGGGAGGLSDLRAGDFVTAAAESTVPCLSTLEVLAPPSVYQCATSGLPSDGDVRWEGFNQSAHSVLYRGVSYGPLQAERWCGVVVVTGPHDVAIKMSQIPVGAVVNIYLNGNDWVSGVNYCGRQECYG
jgi:hypothetical protein